MSVEGDIVEMEDGLRNLKCVDVQVTLMDDR